MNAEELKCRIIEEFKTPGSPAWVTMYRKDMVDEYDETQYLDKFRIIVEDYGFDAYVKRISNPFQDPMFEVNFKEYIHDNTGEQCLWLVRGGLYGRYRVETIDFSSGKITFHIHAFNLVTNNYILGRDKEDYSHHITFDVLKDEFEDKETVLGMLDKIDAEAAANSNCYIDYRFLPQAKRQLIALLKASGCQKEAIDEMLDVFELKGVPGTSFSDMHNIIYELYKASEARKSARNIQKTK